MPIKPMVKTGRSEVKSPISLTRDLGFTSRSEEDDVGGVRTQLMLNVLCCASLISEDHDSENWFDINNV
jgi:hypothetical protein